jgi:hypothetical protein
MKSRALRLFLLTLFVGLLGAAAYIVWTEERQGRTMADASSAFDELVRTASRALLDIRHAQSGYVAAGQGDDFWAARVDTLLSAARDSMTSLQARARTREAQERVETAAEAFDDFQQMDRRARNYARAGQRLLASDLVFSDGFDKIDVALSALDGARQAEQEAGGAALRAHRRSQWLALAGAAAAGMFIISMLVPVPQPAAPARPAAARPAAARSDPSAPAASASLPLHRAGPGTAPGAPTPSTAPSQPAPAAATIPAPLPAVDLPGIASLCTDLARVLDMQALPPALERAAGLLHAAGIVIWIADPDRRELAPVMAHGYPPQVMARMGTIGCDDENVTAAAFRTGLVQIVKAGGEENGAIASPLMTPAGPVGVMAAEVLPGRASDDSARAAAVIVAAQLATLVGPPAARTASGAAGA